MAKLYSDKFQEYLEGWRRRQEMEKELIEKRREQALLDARRIAQFLVQKYGVRKIILFGSLARGDFDLHSDLDLAIEGLDKAKYFRALVEVGDLTEFPVDLKYLDECQGLIRERIDKEGIVLHEAQSL